MNIEQLIADAEKQREARSWFLPDDQHCLVAMFQVYQRLKELGWQDELHAPRDGSTFLAITVDSAVMSRCMNVCVDPHKKPWWLADDGKDVWRPVQVLLWKPLNG